MTGNNGGDDTSSLSPKNRVKFMCSHGGKILPRPVDCNLKYVGGETRVVAVPRDINFPELMKKLSELFDGDMILKYQLIPEDLDALVSVRCDDDVKHMFDEYDRLESEGTPRLRAFLFPTSPTSLENQAIPQDPHGLEQRYVDAINGIVLCSSSHSRSDRISANHPIFSISSGRSSPKSPSPDALSDCLNHDTISLVSSANSRIPTIHKVGSSPSLCTLHQQHHSNHLIHQDHYHYYQNHHQQQHNAHHLSQRPPSERHRTVRSERMSPVFMGRAEIGRSQMGGYSPSFNLPRTRHLRGTGCCSNSNRRGSYEESVYGGCSIDRAESLPKSPRKLFWE